MSQFMGTHTKSNYHEHLDHTCLFRFQDLDILVHSSNCSNPPMGSHWSSRVSLGLLARYLLQEDSGRDARWSMAEDDGAVCLGTRESTNCLVSTSCH